MSTVPVLVLGKKKMFASSSKGKSSHRLAVATDDLDDFPRDVYGAVVQNIDSMESTTDDPGIDILHSLLLDSNSAEEAAKRCVHIKDNSVFTSQNHICKKTK